MTMVCVAVAACAGGWEAGPELVEELSQKRPDFNYVEARVPEYTLPPLLPEGATADDWSSRREELVGLIREDVYGVFPDGAETSSALSDAVRDEPLNADYRAVTVTARRGGLEHAFTGHLFLPADADGPVPVFILIDNRRAVDETPEDGPESEGFWPVREIVRRGYGTLAFRNHDVDPDQHDGYRNGVHALFADRREAESATWTSIAAWAWGVSRFVDALETVDAVDADRIAVIGHSRGGKTALCAGVYDDRIALTVSNESGCGGSALSRRRFGETVARINEVFPHWFCDRFSDFNGREDELPLDQHTVIASIAPRAVCVGSADRDLWADPRGEYLSLTATDPVFALFGDDPLPAMPPLDSPIRTSHRGYHIRSGSHNLTEADWAVYLDFADRLWRRD